MTDDYIENRTVGSAAITPAAAAREVQRLTVARIVAMSSSGGMAIAQAVVTIVGMAMLLAGKTEVILAGLKMLPATAAFALIAWPAIRWIDRRIVHRARTVTGPEMVPRLLESITNSFPLGRSRPALEQGLADSLNTIDAEWWEKNRRLMGMLFPAALETMRSPTVLRPPDGPWLPALFEAVARCGRSEQLKRVLRFESAAKRKALPEPVLQSVRRCAEELEAQIEHNRQFGRLLRPAAESDSTLLRTAAYSVEADPDGLLRPAGAAEIETIAQATSITSRDVSEPELVQLDQRASN